MIKESEGAIKWTHRAGLAAIFVRLQLHALAYNLSNFLGMMATLEPFKD